jgi:chromosomal replication initiator protein
MATALEKRQMPPFEVADAGQIVLLAAHFFHLPAEQLMGRSRECRVVQIRHIVQYVLREHTTMSYPQLGRLFGRDHSSLIHAHTRIAQRIIERPGFKHTINVFVEFCVKELEQKLQAGSVEL